MYFERFGITKGIDLAESNSSKECIIFHHWVFNDEFKYQYFVCNGCHDLKMLSVNVSNTVIITVKNVDYRCITHNRNFGAVNLFKNALVENHG